MPKQAAAAVVSGASREAYVEWVDRNPLRAFRLAQDPKMGLLECASRIGVGMSMMQGYERGANKPGKVADAVAALLGPDWSQRWDAWLADRPA